MFSRLADPGQRPALILMRKHQWESTATNTAAIAIAVPINHCQLLETKCATRTGAPTRDTAKS